MRKFASASLLALSIATGASAADLPRKSVAPVFVPPAFTWAGFYVGVNAGYGWADFKRTATPGTGFNLGPAGNATIASIGTQTFKADGFTGGVQAGYNWQFGSFVLGIEADFNYIDAKRSFGPVLTVPTFPFNTYANTSKLEWFGTVRPRLGVAFDRLLVYATGGLIYGSVKVTDQYVFLVGRGLGGSSSSTRFGYTVGAGLEYAVTNNLTVKAEYLFGDLGKTTYVHGTLPAFADAGFTHQNKTTLNVVRAGVNYKF
jgi:outer membrane immunogenic protein